MRPILACVLVASAQCPGVCGPAEDPPIDRSVDVLVTVEGSGTVVSTGPIVTGEAATISDCRAAATPCHAGANGDANLNFGLIAIADPGSRFDKWTTQSGRHCATAARATHPATGPLEGLDAASPSLLFGCTATFVADPSAVSPFVSSFSPTSGVPGDTVTVTGGGFDPARTDLVFPTLSGIFVLLDEQVTTTTVSGRVPEGAVSGELRVVTPVGQAKTDAFTVSAGNTSPDAGTPAVTGPVWTERSSGTTRDLVWVGFIDDEYVAQGTGGNLVTSPDGLTWTSRQVSGYGGSSDDAAIAYSTLGWVMASTFNAPTSSDFVTWTDGALAGATDKPDVIKDVREGPGGFLAAGREYTTQARALFSSLDGITWSLVFKGPADTGAFDWLGKLGDRWYAAGAFDTAMYTSTDATQWSRIAEGLFDGAPAGYSSWASNGSRRLAWSSREEDVVLSDDGVTWRTRSNSGDTGGASGSLLWDGQAFLLPGFGISNSGVVFFSANGEHWDVQNGVSTHGFDAGTSDGPRIVIVGRQGTIYTAEKR